MRKAKDKVKKCRGDIESKISDVVKDMDDNLVLSPSHDWNWIKSIKKITKSLRKEFLSDDFFDKHDELSNLDQEGPSGGNNKVGIEWDKIMQNFIQERGQSPQDKKIAESLLKAIQGLCDGLVFLDSQFPLYGFMNEPVNDMIYLWKGKADAIAWYKGKYVIVDWKAVDLNPSYWDSNHWFCAHVHQCLVYAKLLQLHLKLPYLPYILIVPINTLTGREAHPGLFKDYYKDCKDKLNEFEWSLERPEASKVVYLDEKLFKMSDGINEDTKLKDLFKKCATVKDLKEAFGLPKLKFKKKEESESSADPPLPESKKKIQKNKTSK